MSATPLEIDGQPPDTALLPISSENKAWGRALEHSPCWPVTRLVGPLLTLALVVAILAPVGTAHARGVQWLILVLPATIAALSARAVFEMLVSAGRGRGPTRHFLSALPPTAVAVGLITGGAAIVGIGFSVSTTLGTGALALLILTTAGAARDVEIRMRRSLRRVFLVGSVGSQRDLERELSRRRDATLVGVAAADRLGDWASLIDAIRATDATVLVLDREAMLRPQLVGVTSTLNIAGLQIRDLVSYYESEFNKVPLGELSPTWFLFDVAPTHRRLIYRCVRRGAETAIAAGLLLLAAPVLLIAAIAIRLTSPGPILFRQQRIGRGGETIALVKLRTMRVREGGEAQWAGSETARITSVGHVLRRFRLDELPQLWSVIRGDLALIGPRPEQVEIADRLSRELVHYNARHCLRPGLTGWAQVTLGYAGSVEGTIAKLQRDLYYIKHRSLQLDALILWLTFTTMIAGRG